MGRKLNDLTGKTFGSLTVIERVVGPSTPWKCFCSACGKTKIVISGNLVRGSQKSCGCLRGALGRVIHTTHGLTGTPIHGIWAAMKARCYNSKTESYKYYGARGVRVCDEWRDSFEAFYRDMGPRPDGMSIDRIDTNGHYEPSNCRWATMKEQKANQRPRESREFKRLRWLHTEAT